MNFDFGDSGTCAYVMVECPICGKQRPYPARGIAQKEIVDGIVAHILQLHPATEPERAEAHIEHALDRSQPVDAPDLEVRGWDEYDVGRES